MGPLHDMYAHWQCMACRLLAEIVGDTKTRCIIRQTPEFHRVLQMATVDMSQLGLMSRKIGEEPFPSSVSM